MSLKTVEDAKLAIEDIELSIKEMDGNTDLVFDNICQTYGEINDLKSFIEFYKNYFLDFDIFKEQDFESEAKKLWADIDLNKDNQLDEKGRESLVKNISFQTIIKIKEHFNIN